jgi:hypothetical protein
VAQRVKSGAWWQSSEARGWCPGLRPDTYGSSTTRPLVLLSHSEGSFRPQSARPTKDVTVDGLGDMHRALRVYLERHL